MKFDLKHCYVGKRTKNASTGKIEYTDKQKLGAIACDISTTVSSASQNEDGIEKYKINRVTGGTLEYETGTFTDEQKVYLLGATKGTDDVIISKDLDIAPELGQGFIVGVVNADGSHAWKAMFLVRVQYKLTSESYKTGGKETNLESYKLSADWMVDDDGVYSKSKTFTGLTAEQDAMAWVDSMFEATQ